MSWWSRLFGGHNKPKESVIPINAPSYAELVKQVDELEEELHLQRPENKDTRKKLLAKIQEDGMTIGRFKAALEFYARARRYMPHSNHAQADAGHRARKALGEA